MILILTASKDTYITNRTIKNIDVSESNVGISPTLDLFKLSKVSGSLFKKEISRLLLEFSYNKIQDLFDSSKIDLNNFTASLELKSVFGGQTLPRNFDIELYPLAHKFDEGIGRDNITYKDIDISNFITASSNPETLWFTAGASSSGSINDTSIDYFLNSSSLSLKSEQHFETGKEDLNLNITNLISCSLTNQFQNHGFIIKFSDIIENDDNTYFVKRFASKQSFDQSKQPILKVIYDDSISDDLLNTTFNISGSTFLYNYKNNSAEKTNIISGSTQITGSNCLLFKLFCEENNSLVLSFSGSQMINEINNQLIPGSYVSNYIVNDSLSEINQILNSSGSINFKPKWTSVDGTIIYQTNNLIELKRNSNSFQDGLDYYLSIKNIKADFSNKENVLIEIYAFEKDRQLRFVKKPMDSHSLILKNLFYSIRDIENNNVIIDFNNGTKISNDTKKMFFTLDTSNLSLGRTYTIDLKIIDSGFEKIYRNVSQNFRIK